MLAILSLRLFAYSMTCNCVILHLPIWFVSIVDLSLTLHLIAYYSGAIVNLKLAVLLGASLN